MGGKGSGRKANPLPCGTPAAYYRHRRKKENCTACKKAVADLRKARYKPKERKRSEQSRIKGRVAIIEEKLRRGSCLDCGMKVTIENYFCFDFDHRDPTKKAFTISAKSRDVAESVLLAEFAKCDVVCANCHRIRTHKQFKTGVLTGMKKTGEVRCETPTLFDAVG